jgi:acyl-coenzyme A thioesterase PaaI-like protein
MSAGDACGISGNAVGFSTIRGVILATKEEIAAFLAAEFPQTKCVIQEVPNGGAVISHEIGPSELRPGGTVAGPVLMTVADVALYVAILGEIGIVPLVVTTNLTINFMRKPPANKTITGVCKLMKVGKSLAVGEVWLYSAGNSDPVAHVVGTYSIPPRDRAGDPEIPPRTA